MSKLLKLTISTIILFLFFSVFNTVLATNVSQNDLIDNSSDTVIDNSSTNSSSSLTSNSDDSSVLINDETTSNGTTSESSGVAVSQTSSLAESDLVLADYLNIFLCVLGVLLILLGIAIFTQVKK